MADVVIIAIGSRGDVAPLTGVGTRLQQAGHRVTLVAYGMFAELATGCGLEFRAVADDLDSGAMDDLSGSQQLRGLAGFLAPNGIRTLGNGILDAVGDMPMDVLLLSPFAELAGHALAEARAVPAIGLRMQPLSATADYPPAVLGAWSAGGRGNRVAAQFGEWLIDRLYNGAVADFRRRLGLPRADSRILRRARTDAEWPVLHGYSPSVLTAPTDWRPGLEVVGYWWPAHPANWQPPELLSAFLAAGPAPVVVSFGSLISSRAAAQRTSQVVADALRNLGVRGVIQSGWSGLEVDGGNVLTVAEVPHDWLFTRATAVIHHCGAGTAAAGLRAGIPAVAVPANYGDQPFWARRLVELGVGPEPTPQPKLSAGALTAALETVLHNGAYRANAERIARRIADEDGAGRVVQRVHDLLTTDRSRTRAAPQ